MANTIIPTKANKHIVTMIKSGANIIDIGSESTRPGSKTIPENLEWQRIKNIVENFKKNIKKSVCLLIQENQKLWPKPSNLVQI